MSKKQGMCVNGKTTEYLSTRGDATSKVTMQGEKITTLKQFQYLGSTAQKEKNNKKDTRGWINWKKVSGKLCDRKMSTKIKGKVHKMLDGKTSDNI